MQTMAPPEDAIAERFARLEERIAVVDRRMTETAQETNRRIAEGREETNHRFDRVEGDAKELKESVAAVHSSVLALHTTLMRVGVGLAIVFASALFAKGF